MDEVIPPLVAAAVSQGQQHQPKATQSNALTFSLSFRHTRSATNHRITLSTLALLYIDPFFRNPYHG
jgi:hypothetical protein